MPYASKKYLFSVKKMGHSKSLDVSVEVSSRHLFLICVYLVSLQIVMHLLQMNTEHFIC